MINEAEKERMRKLRKTFDMLRRLEKVIFRPFFPTGGTATSRATMKVRS